MRNDAESLLRAEHKKLSDVLLKIRKNQLTSKECGEQIDEIQRCIESVKNSIVSERVPLRTKRESLFMERKTLLRRKNIIMCFVLKNDYQKDFDEIASIMKFHTGTIKELYEAGAYLDKKLNDQDEKWNEWKSKFKNQIEKRTLKYPSAQERKEENQQIRQWFSAAIYHYREKALTLREIGDIVGLGEVTVRELFMDVQEFKLMRSPEFLTKYENIKTLIEENKLQPFLRKITKVDW